MDAYARLLEEHGPALLLYARQWIVDRHTAEDALQEALLSCWRNDPTLARVTVPLMFVAMRHAALNLARGEQRRKNREVKVFTRAESDFVCAPADGELREVLEQALVLLPIEQREVVVLHLWADLTFAQVAEIMGCTLNTTTSRYRYALVALRERLPSHEALS